MWSQLVQLMADIINFFYGITIKIGFPNYGLAIILLTIAIKMVLYPLTLKQMKSMKVIQQLQPKVKELQERYSKDPQKAQIAIMELYREHKASPFSSCLPILIQMPILIALYKALSKFFTHVDVEAARFFWVSNLGQKDPLYILPILAAASTYLLQKLSMTSNDQTQKTMLYIMPVFIGMMSVNFPAGLVLYWITFNVVGAAQQYIINKSPIAANTSLGEAGTTNENSRKKRKDN